MPSSTTAQTSATTTTATTATTTTATATTAAATTPAVTTTTTSTPTPARPARKDPTYLRYLAGQTLSGIGDQVWYVALAWAAVQQSSAGTAGFVLSVSAIPRLFLLLFGGVLADRYDIRKLMIGSDVLRAVVCFGAAGIALANPGIWMLILLAVVFGAVDAIFLPAAGALRPRLLEPDQYKSGAVLFTVAGRLALTVGAPLGGILIAFGGFSTALLVDAITFTVSVGTLATVRPRAVEPKAANGDGDAEAKEPFWTSFRGGIAYLAHHRVLGPLTVAGLLVNLGFVGPMNVGVALLAQGKHWGAPGVGVMLTGFGVGAMLGAIGFGKVRISRNVGAWYALFGVLQGLTVFAMALSPNLPCGVIATAAAGMLASPMGILSAVLSQAHTDDEYRGRVSSVTTLVNLGIVPLAMGFMGLGVAAFGLTGAFAISGALEAVAVFCLLAPKFRTARNPS